MIWQRRHSVLVVLFCAYLLCYMDRMAIATAIPFIAADFQLSPLAMGGVLSAFFAGYALMQIPGGLLADKLGPNRVMTASIAGWSIFTALTGAASSLPALMAIRVLFGVCEGPFPSTASKTIAVWFPPNEAGRANGVQLAAVTIGAALAPAIVAPAILGWGWRAVFYALLLPGLLMTLLVWMFIKDSPSPAASAQIAARGSAGRIPLIQVLKMPTVVWCAVTLFGASLASSALMNWLPTYLLQARGFSTAKMGLWASLPFLPGAVGYYLGGHISDKYFSRRRHLPILVGLIGAGAMTYIAAGATSGEWAVAALAAAFLFHSIASAGIFTLPIVAVPAAAVGVAFGIVNTVGQLAGLLSPLLVGYALDVTHGNFHWVFGCIAGVFAVAACAVLPIGRHAGRLAFDEELDIEYR